MLLASPALAAPDLKPCIDETVEIPGRAANCTALIQSGALSGRDLAMVLHERGVVYFLAKRFDMALTDFDAAAKADPDFADTYADRAAARVIKGDMNGCIADLNRAVALDPNNLVALMQLGNYYHNEKHDLATALTHYDKALGAGDESARAHLRLSRADVYAEKKDFKSALADYDEAINLAPKNVLALCGRAGVVEQQGDRKAAIKAYDACLDVKPTDDIDCDLQRHARDAEVRLITNR